MLRIKWGFSKYIFQNSDTNSATKVTLILKEVVVGTVIRNELKGIT